jgi:uncharacterized membrane protein YedE/YeeE
MEKLNWLKSGIILGSVFFIAVLLVKPIGVSTQFVILDAIIGDKINSELITETDDGKIQSTNSYLNKSGAQYAKSANQPLNYSFMFVIALAIGAFISSQLRNGVGQSEKLSPKVWNDKFGKFANKRFLVTFVSGFVVLFGARLAGGCTSGHMMSGLMQTSISAYLFTLGIFLAAIPTAMIVYNKSTNRK